ncbi:MAG TPA: thioredoxin [Ruminiclostridium sp.]|nr:thioredoxin [Ruminiclostridium sp.]
MPLTISSQNYDSEVMKSDKPVLIDFWATWCGPCRMIAPVVDELETELHDKIKVGKVNVDEEPGIASKFNVMSIPTLVVVKDGSVAATAVGARPKEEIKQMLGL